MGYQMKQTRILGETITMCRKSRMRNSLSRTIIGLLECRLKTRKEILFFSKTSLGVLLTVSCVIFLVYRALQDKEDPLADPKAPLQCSLGRPASVEHGPDVYYHAVPSTILAPETLAAQQLRDLILWLTDIAEPAVVRLLNSALSQRCADAQPLLTQLWDFTAKYACSSCTDTRPLPKTALDAKIRLPHDSTWRGLRLPVISVFPKGRLGNLMGEYATLYALQKIYNVSAVLTPDFANGINVHFKSISVPVMREYVAEEWTEVPCDLELKNYGYKGEQLAAAGLLGAKAFLFKDYPFESFIFNAFRDDIRSQFAFRDNITQKATARLQEILGLVRGDREASAITTVGTHVRLTDYPAHMDLVFSVGDITRSYTNYLLRATKYFTELHPDAVFVVTSDDLSKTRNIFEELQLKNVFVSQGSPEEDMSLLTQCDHNIITFGSYSFWTGYLGRGTTVYPDLNVRDLKYPHSKAFYEAANIRDFVPIVF